MTEVRRSPFGRYVIVGGGATVLQYVIYIFLVNVLGRGVVESSAVGYFVSSVANYALSYCFTFRSAVGHSAAITRYVIVVVVGLVLNSAVVHVLSIFGAQYLIAQIIATVIVVGCNYSAGSRWVFRGQC